MKKLITASTLIVSRNIIVGGAVAFLCAGCAGNGDNKFNKLRGSLVNGLHEAKLEISPSLEKQVKIENAHVYSPGMALMVEMEVTPYTTCQNRLTFAGKEYDSEGLQITGISGGSLAGVDKGQKIKIRLQSEQVGASLGGDKVSVIKISKVSCS